MMEMLANAVMAIPLQYVSISNQNVVNLKLIQCYTSITSQ